MRVKESWLIQALGGTRRSKKCLRCVEGRPGDFDLWVQCRTVQGLYDGACANCKRQEKGLHCTLSKAFMQEETEAEKYSQSKDRAESAEVERTVPASSKDRTCKYTKGYFNG